MDRRLLEAAISDDFPSLKQQLALDDPGVLLATTPQGNTCLHISFMHGHQEFCKSVVAISWSLLTAVNADGETPLLAAVISGHSSLVSSFLEWYRKDHRLREREALTTLGEALTKQDQNECNALHHAIRSGHRVLALELIAVAVQVGAGTALSGAVNKYGESPMFIAVMRDYEDVFNVLLNIPGSAHVGTGGYNALHAAVRNGNSGESESEV